MPEPPRTGDAVLDLVRKSELVDDDVLENFLTRSGPLPVTAPDTATRMVQDGILTQFQAKLILQGKYRGFRIGSYKILDQLGVGGMGQVFLAEHTTMRRKVALKVLPAKLSADRVAVERFIREARAVAALDHPNIVRAHDVGTERGTHFLVLEYVEGQNLENRLRDAGGRLPWGEAVGYVVQAAAGLQHAHEKGLVHRDIKPANILVDKEGVVKVLDMGLARFFTDENDKLTTNLDGGAVMGTADYVAPEQLLNSSGTDHRADIYSLGTTLYHLVTGRTPFEGTTTAKLVAHQLKTAEPAHEANPEIPEELSDIIGQMMAKDPDERYQLMAEVVRDLLPYAAEGPTSHGSGSMPAIALAAVTRTTGDLRAALTATATTEVQLPGEDESPRTRRKKALAIGGLGACILGGCGLIALALMNAPQPQPGDKTDDGPSPLTFTPQAITPTGTLALTPAFKLAVDKAGSEVMVFTPDGRKLVTATDKSVRVWDAFSGKQIRKLDGHTAGVRGLSLLPGGRRVLSSSHDKTVRLWDVETGELLRTYQGATSSVTNVAALPNGRRFLTTAADGTIWLWDLDSEKVVNDYPDLRQSIPIYGLAVTRDGRKGVFGTWDSKRNSAKNADEIKELPPTQVWVFEIETGKVLLKQNVPASVAHINLSPDSKQAVFGTDKGIGILDVDAKQDAKSLRAYGGLSARPVCAVFSGDGRYVVATGLDKSLSLWEARSGQVVTVEPELPGQGNGLALSPDGRKVAAGGSGGGAGVWDLPTAVHPTLDNRTLYPVVRLTGMAADMEDVIYTPDGKVIGCGGDRTVRVWDPATGEELRRMAVPAKPRGLTLLTGDRVAVTAHEGKDQFPIQLFNWKTGLKVKEFTSPKAVRMVAAMPEGRRFLSYSDDQTVRMWDADGGGDPLASFAIGANGQGLAVTPDGSRFLVGCSDKTIRLWDIAGNYEVRRLPLAGIAYRITVSRDGRWAAFGNDTRIQFWDLRDGAERSAGGPGGPTRLVDQVSFTRDGRFAVAASNDRGVYVVDVNAASILTSRVEHPGPARGAVISPDGKFATTSSGDGIAIVWHLPPEVVPK
jgi:serine/threonine-protein kinase